MDQTSTNYKDTAIWKRLRVDLPFRRRFVHTMCVLWSFIGLGWAVGQLGPSFPDLRLIVQKDLDTASWLFSVTGFGYLVGSLVGGVLYDRFNKILLIAFSAAILATFSAITPWCKWFPLMLVARFISGLGCGGLDTGGNADLISLWDDEGRSYMQALHLFFGLGGIMSPLVTKPFLAEAKCVPTTYNDSAKFTVNTSLSSITTATCEQVYENTNVHYAYLITACIVFSGTLPFFVIFVNRTGDKQNASMVADRSDLPYPNPLPIKQKTLFLILLVVIFLTYCAIEDTYAGYLATFCINYFHWDSGTSSLATSLYWTLYSVGRFLGIFLVRCFKPVQLLLLFLVLLLLSFVGFLISSLTYSSNIFWLFVALPGFSMSVIFPGIFSWTEESILKVSGMVSSLFLIAASSGFMVNPLFLGYLMDNKSPIWFVYILLGENVLCLTTVLVVLYLSKRFVTVSVPKFNRTETTATEQVTHM